MAEKMIRQTSFRTGEVDETTWKRTDIEEYITAAQSLRNMEVGTTGLTKKRRGSIFTLLATSYATQNSRMYELIDKNDISYLVMSADHLFHIFSTPAELAQVITGRGTDVVTGRGTDVVAFDQLNSFLQSVVTPYGTNDLAGIDYTQDNDTLILTHPLYPPARIYISNYSPLTFAYQVLDIFPLPSYDFSNINYNGFTVSLSVVGSTLTFIMTNPSGATGFTTAWIGGSIIGGGATDIDPVGYAIITNVVNAGNQTTFTALVQIPFKTSGFSTFGSQYSVQQPAWSASLGYPAKVLYYQNRLWMAKTKTLPETIFGSKINKPINFDVGTGKDTDAIVYTIGITDSGSIQWLNGGKQLEIMCANLEFACPQDQNSALTPATFVVKQQSSYGSSTLLKPITYINDSYFTSKTGKSFIDYRFQGVGLAYAAGNISAAASHLVKNPSNRALLRGSDSSQDNFIYFLNPDDDTLTAFQFAAEYKLAALTPIEFQDHVELIDIVSVANEIYILKYYALTAQFMLEKFTSNQKIDNARSASMDSDGVVTGLATLEGYRVQVVYNNQDFGEYLVSNGQIIVNNPNEISDNVTIGLLYDNEVRPMYPFVGSAAAPFMKQLSRIYIDYYQSLNFYINGTLVPYQTFAEIQAGLPLTPKTDTAIFSPVSGYARFDRDAVVITQRSPFDLQILAIAYQIDAAVI